MVCRRKNAKGSVMPRRKNPSQSEIFFGGLAFGGLLLFFGVRAAQRPYTLEMYIYLIAVGIICFIFVRRRNYRKYQEAMERYRQEQQRQEDPPNLHKGGWAALGAP